MFVPTTSTNHRLCSLGNNYMVTLHDYGASERSKPLTLE